ncbi:MULTISPECIES: DUF6745 domain-containing protein [Aerosakkonema]|uniref:DUF6745 domain-containing protein n=1 Tax=Aerosakkonema TaxID=1246629 RepID=UPI0035BAC72A
MKFKIENLTPDQVVAIGASRDKWRAIALSTERIDRQKAALAIQAVYSAIGLGQPQIQFFDSPFAALQKPPSLLGRFLGSLLRGKIEKQLDIPPGSQLGSLVENNLELEAIDPLKRYLWTPLSKQLGIQLGNSLWKQLRNQLTSQNDNCIQPELWAVYASAFDYCISVLNCEYSPGKWEALQSVAKECGWIFPWQKTCFVCDRPSKLSFDNERRLHAEGTPAIQFTDGFSVYAYHGVVIPEKYGIIPPQQWQARWILEESDRELKQVLAYGIGMRRIRQELGNIELDL